MADDPVPPEVLLDFRTRTVVSVANPRWDNAEHTMLTADVLFQELAAMGPVGFTTMADADTVHGREVWNKANAGDYGPIAEYDPSRFPPPPPDPIETLTKALEAALARIEALEAR